LKKRGGHTEGGGIANVDPGWDNTVIRKGGSRKGSYPAREKKAPGLSTQITELKADGKGSPKCSGVRTSHEENGSSERTGLMKPKGSVFLAAPRKARKRKS